MSLTYEPCSQDEDESGSEEEGSGEYVYMDQDGNPMGIPGTG